VVGHGAGVRVAAVNSPVQVPGEKIHRKMIFLIWHNRDPTADCRADKINISQIG